MYISVAMSDRSSVYVGGRLYCIDCKKVTNQAYTCKEMKTCQGGSPLAKMEINYRLSVKLKKKADIPYVSRVLVCMECNQAFAYHRYRPKRKPRACDGSVSRVYF